MAQPGGPEPPRRMHVHRHAPPILAIIVIIVGVSFMCSKPSEGSLPEEPFLRYRALPADSVDARRAAILEDPAWFAFGFDSTLALGGLAEPATVELLEGAADAHFEATGDSLLLRDLTFVRGLDASVRPDWYRAMAADDMAGIHQAERDYDAAADSFRVAAEGYRAVGDLRREAVAWGSLGVAIWFTGDFEAVVAAYDEALAARRRLGDPVLVGRTLNGLGSAYLRLADLERSLDYYQQARAVRETLGNPVDLGVTLTYIGNVNYQLGYLADARSNYLHAAEVFPEDTPERRLVENRTGLANVHFDLGEYDEALELYRQNVDAAVAADSPEQADLNRNNMARVLRARGEYLEARRLLEIVREGRLEREDYFRLAATSNAIGEVYVALGETEQALREFREARTVAEEAGNAEAMANSLHHLAVTYLEMGLADKAIETCNESMAISEEIGDTKGVRNLLGLMASAYEDKGEPETALELNLRALAIDEERGLKANLAQDYTAIGNSLNVLGRFEEARAALGKAELLAEEVGRRDIQWYVHMITADNFERAGKLDSARVYNERAIEVLESLRGEAFSEGAKAGFLGGARSIPYESQIQVLAKMEAADPGEGYAEEALAFAERGKARALLDILESGHVDLDVAWSGEDKEERARLERGLNETQLRLRWATEGGAPRDTVRALKQELRDLETEYAALRERARLAHPQMATVDAGTARSVDDLRRSLLTDGNDLLLEYSLSDSGSYVWAMTRKSFSLHRLPPRSVLEPLVETVRRSLSSPLAAGDAAYLQAAHELHLALLAPVAKQLGKADDVYIVPDGALHFLPFEALLTEPVDLLVFADESERSGFFRELPYALVEQRVRYGPSATTLAVLRESLGRDRERSMDLLAVGDPAFLVEAPEPVAVDTAGTRSGLAPLPFSRTEVETIVSRFPEGKTKLLVGEAASEATLRSPGYCAPYRVIHFATHGLVDQRRPELSSLALAEPKSSDEDGYLQAREIYGLDLRADLVVLSACETGLGKQIRGEGVLGLPRAFFYAGTPAVVVSLWSVADVSTSDLMVALYDGLAEREDPAQALAKAKRTLRTSDGYGHPFYWAPFVLMGVSSGS